jgi:hypothetical protein
MSLWRQLYRGLRVLANRQAADKVSTPPQYRKFVEGIISRSPCRHVEPS